MLTVLYVAIDGVQKQRFWLRFGQTASVGRSEAACFAITGEPSLDDVHFALKCHENGCRVKDLSTDGTFVNEKPIEEGELYHGDRITIGRLSIEIAIEGQAGDTRPAEIENALMPAPIVTLESDIKEPQYVVGSWCFVEVADDWEFEEDKGFTRKSPGAKPEFVQVSEHAFHPVQPCPHFSINRQRIQAEAASLVRSKSAEPKRRTNC